MSFSASTRRTRTRSDGQVDRAAAPPGHSDGGDFTAASARRRFEFEVGVHNLTGHKFPTGYPARRAWLHVRVLDDDGGPLFESGALSSDGAIVGNDNDADPRAFEAHYETIDRDDQVEIYESILGDADSRPTTGLLSAVKYLKDNRLLPRGFDKKTADPQIGVFGAASYR